MITIYHKSSCSTSTKVLNMLKDSGKKYKIVEYIKTPLTEVQLTQLLAKLNLPAESIVRKKELVFKEQFSQKQYSEKEWIKILSENPNLMERPILEKRTKAIVGRPPEIVEKWI